MWSHSSIRATTGPSVLLQTGRDRQRKRLETKRETVTMVHWYNGPADISDILYRWASGKERSVVQHTKGLGVWGTEMFACIGGGGGSETEELLPGCSSIWTQSWIPRAMVGVRSKMGWNKVQQTLTGFPFLDLMTAFWLNSLTVAVEPVSNLGHISECIISEPMLIIYVS